MGLSGGGHPISVSPIPALCRGSAKRISTIIRLTGETRGTQSDASMEKSPASIQVTQLEATSHELRGFCARIESASGPGRPDERDDFQDGVARRQTERESKRGGAGVAVVLNRRRRRTTAVRSGPPWPTTRTEQTSTAQRNCWRFSAALGASGGPSVASRRV